MLPSFRREPINGINILSTGWIDLSCSKPRPLASRRVDPNWQGHCLILIEEINSNHLPSHGSGGVRCSRGLPTRPPFCRQFSKMFCSESGGCSRRVSTAPTLSSPISRGLLLRFGSCLALGRRPFSPSPTLKLPLLRGFAPAWAVLCGG